MAIKQLTLSSLFHSASCTQSHHHTHTHTSLTSQVKTSKVYVRDSTLIHPLTLLLFAGRSLDVISEGMCVCVCLFRCVCVGVLVKYVFVSNSDT